ncbi:MAG TPA: putative lipid II flippase FtsW [Candidatus Saccharimonadales bacterium]|nr:putative lipid II flippase FtsW [Candidatus Saccharimonadales bacterium]
MKAASIVLFFCVTALLALGMVMLISSSTGLAITPKYLFLQPVWCILGFLACWLASLGDYRWFKKHAWLPWGLLILVCCLLVLVFVPHVGVRIKGASRWLKVGGFTVQPSELAKIALILALAWYGERFQRQMGTFFKGIVVPGLFIGCVLGLIFFEPDVGSFLLMASVSSAMLLIAGIRLRFFLPPVILGMIAMGFFLYNNPMRSERIYSWLHVEETKQDKGMQAYQAMVALGSGGVYGVGLGDGRQKHGFVPEHQTDFIYSVIGEELGLVATMGVVLAFLAIVISGVYIAWNAQDTFGMLLASGITFLIGLQAIINIGVVTGSLPNKGLSLPFISYGGSNLVVMLGCVGLLMNVARHGGSGEKLSRAFESEALSGAQIS